MHQIKWFGMVAAVGSTSARRQNRHGRPEATTHGAIEQAAFQLFAQRGFDGVTLDEIASAVGVGRRTLFRYYRSKNDIPWGQFDQTLTTFAGMLHAAPAGAPLWQAVHDGVRAFNTFPDDAQPAHHERMRLILTTPALQAHSALRYAEWRSVIARFVAARQGTDLDDPLPGLVGHVSLALALAAYDRWLPDPHRSLPDLVSEQMFLLGDHLTTFHGPSACRAPTAGGHG